MGVQAAKDQRALFSFEYFVSFPNHTITVPIENIKEILSGSDARYYRHQYQLSRRVTPPDSGDAQKTFSFDTLLDEPELSGLANKVV